MTRCHIAAGKLPRRALRLALLIAIALLLTAPACGPAPTPLPTAALTFTPVPLPPAAASSPTPVPAAFPTGAFFHIHESIPPEMCVLHLNADGTWAFYHGVQSVQITSEQPSYESGTYTVEGDHVIYDRARTCGGPGTYAWTFEGRTLTLLPLQEECSARQHAFSSLPWQMAD